jgi:hypothetical protein
MGDPMTLFDHSTTPPTAYSPAPGSTCVMHPIYGSVPVANPAPLLPDGGADPVPAGMREVSLNRIVRDGLSVSVPTCEPIPLAEVKAARIEALAAEADARFEARWYLTDRVLSTGGEALTPATPAALEDAKAHNDARDAAIALVQAAADAAAVAAVEAVWPS